MHVAYLSYLAGAGKILQSNVNYGYVVHPSNYSAAPVASVQIYKGSINSTQQPTQHYSFMSDVSISRFRLPGDEATKVHVPTL